MSTTTRARLVALMALAMVAAACGGSEGGNAEQPDSTSEAIASEAPASPTEGGGEDAATITFSNWQFAEPGRGEAMLELIDEFNASQDGVTVEPITIPYPDYDDTVLTQLGAGDGPDIVAFLDAPFFQAQDARLLANLSDVVERPAEDFIASDSMTFVDGERYGVIWEVVNYALIMNQDLLDEAGVEPPADYAEFRAAADAMTSGSEQFGFATRHTMPEEGGWWFDLSNWVYGFGGAWTDSEGSPTANSPEVVEAVTEYVDMVDSGAIPRGADAATYRRMFWEGKIGMMIDNSAVPPIVIGENPDLADVLTVAPTPFEVDSHAIAGGLLGVNANTEHMDAVAAFLNYVLSDDVQAQLGEIMGASAVALPVDAPGELLEESPWVATYKEIAPNGRSVAPEGAQTATAEIRTAVLTQVDAIINSGVEPQEAMDAAQAELEQILGG